MDTFNASLGRIAYAKAGKPFAGKVKRAMREMDASKENTLFMGDQIFTDVLAARFAGIRVALVPPIKDKTDALTRFKRWLERPIMKRFFRRNKK